MSAASAPGWVRVDVRELRGMPPGAQAACRVRIGRVERRVVRALPDGPILLAGGFGPVPGRTLVDRLSISEYTIGRAGAVIERPART